MVQGRTERIDVCPCIGLSLTTELFRCGISASTEPCRIPIAAALICAGCSKVNDYDVAIRLQHDIGGLHIAVNNRRILSVQIAEYVTQLLRPLNYNVRILRSAVLQHTQQILSLYIVHDYDIAVIVLHNVDDADNVGMIELFQHFNFGYKALVYDHVIRAAVLSDLFNRPCFICPLVKSQINGTHTAMADLLKYFIFSVKNRAYFQHIPSLRSICFHQNSADIIIFPSVYIELCHFFQFFHNHFF